MTYKVYGVNDKDECQSENFEMASFFNMLRTNYPDTFGAIAIHIRNEGKRTYGQIKKVKIDGGFVKGASDIIIPGNPSFVMEMKSMSKKAKLSKDQKEYLDKSSSVGCFSCVAYGALAAREAFEDYLKENYA